MIIFFILLFSLINLNTTFNIAVKLIFKYKILKRKLIFNFTEFVIIIKNIKFTITARLIKKQAVNAYKYLNNK